MENYKVKIDNNDYILKFTFNSAKYLDNFEFTQDFEKCPMRVFSMISDLFYASMNWAYDVVYTRKETDELLERYFEDDNSNIHDFLKNLMELLSNSLFFKKLLKQEEKTVKQKPVKK